MSILFSSENNVIYKYIQITLPLSLSKLVVRGGLQNLNLNYNHFFNVEFNSLMNIYIIIIILWSDIMMNITIKIKTI